MGTDQLGRRPARGLVRGAYAVLLVSLLCAACAWPERVTSCGAVVLSTPERREIALTGCAGTSSKDKPVVRLKVGESTEVHRYGNDTPLDLAGSRTEPADLLRVDDHALTAVRTGTARLFLPRPLVACAEVECLMATVVIDGTSQPR